MSEVRRAGCSGGVEDAKKREGGQGSNLRHGKNILNNRAEANAARVDPRDHDDRENRQQILAVESDVVRTEITEEEMPGAEGAKLQYPVRRRKPGDHHSSETRKSYRDRRNRRRLNHQEHRPAVEKAPERPKRFA